MCNIYFDRFYIKFYFAKEEACKSESFSQYKVSNFYF